MPYVFQDGALEAEEIKESMQQVGNELNEAHQQRMAFVVMTDFANDPIIFRIDTITKVKVNP